MRGSESTADFSIRLKDQSLLRWEIMKAAHSLNYHICKEPSLDLFLYVYILFIVINYLENKFRCLFR